jgi:hypothetical protein
VRTSTCGGCPRLAHWQQCLRERRFRSFLAAKRTEPGLQVRALVRRLAGTFVHALARYRFRNNSTTLRETSYPSSGLARSSKSDATRELGKMSNASPQIGGLDRSTTVLVSSKAFSAGGWLQQVLKTAPKAHNAYFARRRLPIISPLRLQNSIYHSLQPCKRKFANRSR